MDARTAALIEPLRSHAKSDVPCNGCVACCRNEFKLLLPEEGDDLATLEHEFVDCGPRIGKRPMLRNKPNGECVYLGVGGCTIHDRAPVICRAFDCRRFVALHTRAERRKMLAQGQVSRDVLAAGRARLDTLGVR